MMGQDDEIEDEGALWAQAMRDVKPLEPTQDKGRKGAARPKPAKKAPSPQAAPSVRPKAAKPGDKKKPLPGKDLDRRTEEKFRKGQIKIAARLDLHGLRQHEAQQALERFILEAYASGKRCVLVITGKGKAKADGDFWAEDGVLKQNVPLWLEQAALAGCILKTAPARPQHGGSGALYVLLRRQR